MLFHIEQFFKPNICWCVTKDKFHLLNLSLLQEPLPRNECNDKVCFFIYFQRIFHVFLKNISFIAIRYRAGEEQNAWTNLSSFVRYWTYFPSCLFLHLTGIHPKSLHKTIVCIKQDQTWLFTYTIQNQNFKCYNNSSTALELLAATSSPINNYRYLVLFGCNNEEY